MKKIFLVIFNLNLFFLTSCSTAPKETLHTSYLNEKTLFVDYINDISAVKKTNSFLNMNYKYTFFYIDLGIEKTDLKKPVINFGKNLDKYGIVLFVNDKSILERKIFLSSVFKKLNSWYEYSDSPFLILYDEFGSPYEVFSFGSSSEDCIADFLERIENSIHKGVESKKTISYLSEAKLYYCNNKKEATEAAKEMVNLIIKKILEGKS